MKKIIIGAGLLATLSGCASIIEGSTQKINVSTAPAALVSCEARNGRGSWAINAVPGPMEVKRSKTVLNVKCDSADYAGQIQDPADAEAWTFGNIIAGGPIGFAIDGATGAMFSYDDVITVPLVAKERPVAIVPQPVNPCMATVHNSNANYTELVNCGAIVLVSPATQSLVTAPVERK